MQTYAHNLSQRGDLLAERDFVAGALDLLTPLAEEESLATASRKLAAKSRAEAQALAGAITARHSLESERLSGLEAHVDEVRVEEGRCTVLLDGTALQASRRHAPELRERLRLHRQEIT